LKISLHLKILIPLSLVIISISSVSTYFFVNSHRQSIEKQLIARGGALSYAMSKAAAEGIAREDLDLIRKAQHIINAEDVTLVQVYTNLWDMVDSYPFSRFRNPPDSDAIDHFRESDFPFFREFKENYDFYEPITFAPFTGSPSATIGFVRISLSTSGMNREIRKSLSAHITASVITAVISIAVLSFLITRIITRRIGDLRKNILLFRDGTAAGAFRPDPSRFAGDEIGDVFAEFGRMSRDITEKEGRLIESKEKTDALFDRVEHAIFRTDDEGRIIETNKKFREMFGSVERICVIMEDVDCIIRAFFEKKISMEKKVKGKDGSEFFIALSLYAGTDRAGNVTGFDGYIMDMTQQKRLEEILLHRQKMEAVGTLAGGVAHDFNNILTAIIGYGNLLLMKMGREDHLKHYIEQILSVSNKAANLTRNLLAFSRKQVINPRPVDLNMIVKNLENLLARLIGEDIELRIRLTDENLVLTADSSQIEQVLMNLATNARDAMPGGGTLTIETVPVVITGANCNIYDLEDPGAYAMISVSDSGTGMDEMTREKIFEPFFTTKETGKGTGLGLSIIYGIIRQHKGNISVYSEPGRGTTFKIYLPLKTSGALETQTEDLSEIKGGTETILLAEDDAAVRNTVREMLERSGYDIIEARDGEEASRVFKENAGRIRLVILDVIMPKKNGREAYREIRELAPHVKAVFMSGYTDDIIHRKGMIEEGLEYLQKPFTPEALLRKVREALDS